MSNIFIKDPVYISVQDLQDTTTKQALKDATEDEVKEVIAKAEWIIDNYIISYWTKFDENQNTIFPILDTDWESSLLPQDIKMAAYFTSVQIFVNGDTIRTSVSTSWSWAIKSEKTWSHSVTYDIWTSVSTVDATSTLWLPQEAIMILKKYRKNFYRNKL